MSNACRAQWLDTSFNLPDGGNGLQGPDGAPNGLPKYGWQYDENHARIKETRQDASGSRITWTLHPDNQGGLAFETETAPNPSGAGNATLTSHRHYLSAGGQVIGVLISSGALPTLGANQTAPTVLASITLVKLEYWHKDHLGSLITTTDHLGSVTARYAYDPFGKRRQTSGTYDPFGALVVDWVNTRNAGTDRGFTGHEHLDDVGIVHMNGRLYDPNLGVMLQPDPFIQDPANLQNFNRYGYCFNNPLTCTDPSGYLSIFGHRILPGLFNKPVFRAVVSIAIAVYAPALLAEYGGSFLAQGTLANAAATGFIAGAASSGNIKGALQGAFTAGVFWGVGQVVGDAGLSRATGEIKDAGKFAGAVALHGVAGCVTAEATGGKCGAGALSAAFSKAALPMTAGMADGLERAAAHAVIGGTASVLGGGKFANGAVTGAFSYLLNHLQSEVRKLDALRSSLTSISADVGAGRITALEGGARLAEAVAALYPDRDGFTRMFVMAGSGHDIVGGEMTKRLWFNLVNGDTGFHPNLRDGSSQVVHFSSAVGLAARYPNGGESFAHGRELFLSSTNAADLRLNSMGAWAAQNLMNGNITPRGFGDWMRRSLGGPQ